MVTLAPNPALQWEIAVTQVDGSERPDQDATAQGDIPAFHQVIGDVVRAWASVENNLWSIASSILGIDQFRTQIVMSSMPGARAKQQFVSRLADTYLDDAILPAFRRLMKRAEKLSRRRNLLAHAAMHINVDGAENLAFRFLFDDRNDRGLDFTAEAMPLKDIRGLASALHTLDNDFQSFTSVVGGNIHRHARYHRESGSRPPGG